ncbi:hypothetical protein HXX76_016256 [Chlamydomonas incerta]|uniref:Uncharacterized protein n=1 Tax=Chlamydomonas incerta TaxID=51695 RepID=A0A835SGN4_CHLIN|nr:hypothetical protein HXX76_016256 [Chlamydomonas incerta]|eukprot:KAG2422134.1 hypothetical protein HXX76_016256 [Chlamydomonas incerta]
MQCDLYIIGAYDQSYLDPHVQYHLQSFVAQEGKGLIVVGPDAMPSVFYSPAGPSTIATYNSSRYRHHQRQLLADGLLGSAGALLEPPPQISALAITVNLVSGPMGLLLSGYVSNPGGNLTLAAPSTLQNAELAAAQLVEYLQGQLVG